MLLLRLRHTVASGGGGGGAAMDSEDAMHDANDSAEDDFYSGGEAGLAASDDGDADYDFADHDSDDSAELLSHRQQLCTAVHGNGAFLKDFPIKTSPQDELVKTLMPLMVAEMCSLAYVKVPGLKDDYDQEAAEYLNECLLSNSKQCQALIEERDTTWGKSKGQGTGTVFIVTVRCRDRIQYQRCHARGRPSARIAAPGGRGCFVSAAVRLFPWLLPAVTCC